MHGGVQGKREHCTGEGAERRGGLAPRRGAAARRHTLRDLDDLDELRTRDACGMGKVRKAWQLKLLPRQRRVEGNGAALLAVHERMQQAPSRAEVGSLAAQAAQLMRSLEALEGALPLKAEEERVQMAVRALQLGHHRLQTGLPSKAGAKEVAQRHRR